MHSDKQQKYLLSIARRSIQHKLDAGEIFQIEEANINSALKEKRAVFVTLTLTGDLRGCIGHLAASQPLYLDVIENALGAAFSDPRFSPLTAEELTQVKIEISVLALPKELDYKNSADLLAKLKPNEDGVILSNELNSATYLPQVWEQILGKEDFLSSLCLKAGLLADSWQNGKLKIQTYTVESFEE